MLVAKCCSNSPLESYWHAEECAYIQAINRVPVLIFKFSL